MRVTLSHAEARPAPCWPPSPREDMVHCFIVLEGS